MRTPAIVMAALGLVACSVDRVPDEGSDAIASVEKQVSGRLDYVELPGGDPETVGKTRDFYAQAFGWTFTDFGPDYAATTTGDVDVGISGVSDEDAITRPLPVIRVDDLERALGDVEAANGRIVRPIFAFPGGRRFHAVDPAGNEFAVYVVDETETGE